MILLDTDHLSAYARLAELFSFLGSWNLVLFDERGAIEFARLRHERIRIGSQNLKIASIAIVNDALLLSANLRDFQRIPGLRVENWLDCR
jgi:tRNA(fMet)-specific endonuclease VapC